MTICQWIRTKLKERRNPELLYWCDKKKGVVAIKWKHAGYHNYNPKDCQLFKEWAEENNRIDHAASESEEAKRWKTNFRCALHQAVNIEYIGPLNKDYRKYKLLTKPDPEKAKRKKESNKRATLSKRKPKETRRNYLSRKLKVKEVKQELDSPVTIKKEKYDDGGRYYPATLDMMKDTVEDEDDDDTIDHGYSSDDRSTSSSSTYEEDFDSMNSGAYEPPFLYYSTLDEGSHLNVTVPGCEYSITNSIERIEGDNVITEKIWQGDLQTVSYSSYSFMEL